MVKLHKKNTLKKLEKARETKLRSFIPSSLLEPDLRYSLLHRSVRGLAQKTRQLEYDENSDLVIKK